MLRKLIICARSTVMAALAVVLTLGMTAHANANGADIAVNTITVEQNPVPAGGFLTYNITLESTDTAIATGAALKFTLPAGTVIQSAAASLAGVSCALKTAPTLSVPGEVDCALGDIPGSNNGWTHPGLFLVQVVVQVDPTGTLIPSSSTSATIIANAAVSTTAVDINSGNDILQFKSAGTNSADLGIKSFTGPSTPVVAGGFALLSTVV